MNTTTDVDTTASDESRQSNFSISGVSLISIYVDDYDASCEFYTQTLGFTNMTAMNEHSCYISLNQTQGLYLIGKHEKIIVPRRAARLTCAFEVDSVTNLFQHLLTKGLSLSFDEPMQMNETTWWFFCNDPAGNQIEFLGGL